jgi:hypothetical protein
MERLAAVALRIHSEHTLERVFQEIADAARDASPLPASLPHLE